ncbi:MAG: hypothetical protein P8M05_02595 [Flavobacteriales bacterium]|nr:hypothetical protein [Flavobacteriales bacterium]
MMIDSTLNKEIMPENVGTWLDTLRELDSTIIIDTVQEAMIGAKGAVENDINTAEGMAAINLMLKVMLILIAGIAIWRVIIVVNKKNAKPKGGQYFKRTYSDKWKNR